MVCRAVNGSRPWSAMSRAEIAFGALVLAQAAHSTEEYVGRLWESFPPARFVSGLVSNDLERAFLFLNVCIVAFGVWCYFWPVRRQWSVAPTILWLWIIVETINGLVHPLWSIRQGGYTPGVVTAVILLGLAVYLAKLVTRPSRLPDAPR
jgi:hypothetical protein